MYKYVNPNPSIAGVIHLYRGPEDVHEDIVMHSAMLVKSIKHWACDAHVSLNHALNAGIYAGQLGALINNSNQATLKACQANIDEANEVLNKMVEA